jgi:hypothetical protein
VNIVRNRSVNDFGFHDIAAKVLLKSSHRHEITERLLIEMIFLEHSAELFNLAKKKALQVLPNETFARLGLSDVPA